MVPVSVVRLDWSETLKGGVRAQSENGSEIEKGERGHSLNYTLVGEPSLLAEEWPSFSSSAVC